MKQLYNAFTLLKFDIFDRGYTLFGRTQLEFRGISFFPHTVNMFNRQFVFTGWPFNRIES